MRFKPGLIGLARLFAETPHGVFEDVLVKNPGGTDFTVRTIQKGGAEYQVVVPEVQSRQDTYTGAANGTTVDVSTTYANKFALQVAGTGGSPSAWDIVLEGSLNNSQFDTVLRHSNVLGHSLGDVVTVATDGFYKYFRSRCISVTLNGATNAAADISGGS